MLIMSKFPIKIDLSEYFDDERRMVLMLVDPDWKTIEGLQRRIDRVFNIGQVSFSTVDGCYIPQTEQLEVLNYIEVIKAYKPFKLTPKHSNCKHVESLPQSTPLQRIQEEVQKHQLGDHTPSIYKHCLSSNSNISETLVYPDLTMKRKYSLDQNDFDSSNQTTSIPQTKRIKSVNTNQPQTLVISSASSPGAATSSTAANLCGTYAYCGSIPADELFNNSLEGNSCLPPIEIVDVGMDLIDLTVMTPSTGSDKKKRKRGKKKKAVSDNEQDPSMNMNKNSSMLSSTMVDENQTTSNKTGKHRQTNGKANGSKNADNNHFYFNDDGTANDTTARYPSPATSSGSGSTVAKVVFHCSLEDLDSEEPRIFSIPHGSKRKPKNREKTPTECSKDADNTVSCNDDSNVPAAIKSHPSVEYTINEISTNGLEGSASIIEVDDVTNYDGTQSAEITGGFSDSGMEGGRDAIIIDLSGTADDSND